MYLILFYKLFLFMYLNLMLIVNYGKKLFNMINGLNVFRNIRYLSKNLDDYHYILIIIDLISFLFDYIILCQSQKRIFKL